MYTHRCYSYQYLGKIKLDISGVFSLGINVGYTLTLDRVFLGQSIKEGLHVRVQI